MPIERWSDSVVVIHLADDPQFTEDLEALDNEELSGRIDAVLDMNGVHSINSSNIARLLRLRQFMLKNERRMVVCNIGAHVWSTLLVTGLDKVFEIAETVATALATIQLPRQ